MAETDLNHYSKLHAKLQTKSAVIGVIGMGYVGLPNMVSKARLGYSVIGFDVDETKVNRINAGQNYISDVQDDILKQLVNQKKLRATNNFSELRLADVIVICVPTPIDEHKQPDLSYIQNATNTIVLNATEGSLIILESTTYPSTTEEIIVKSLEDRGFEIGEDLFVAYSPERIDPSNEVYTIDNTPRIVGGHTERCTELAQLFIGRNVFPVSSTKAAEMTKVYENTFRFVNIALSNELAVICDKMGLDAWEVIEAANTKPYGFMAFYPSVGIGGHCIPVDPYYLSWYSKKYNYNTQMIEIAGEINDRMNSYSIKKVMQILNLHGKTVKGSKIAILGATYKKDIDDVRESPVFRFYESLEELGADLVVYDPHVESFTLNGEIIRVENVNYDKLGEFDVVVLLTNHTDFDYDRIASNSIIIFDTKNGFKEVESFKGDYYKL
ncbi:nucleotide sugar dehydrogenase [Neobacillus dielmonensis]|uniref:nucleotide sugar dehydrogenase n=1 Tax=Neobacillus dielmonensis TaxID=1347369 RepID=UPI000A78678A|nr:nucleotide sugar dehydrogenase [Neobacillus dielmonensis]